MFSKTAAQVTLLPNAVDLVHLLEYSYSSANTLLNMIKILFLQKFEGFCVCVCGGGGGGGGCLFFRYL